MADRGCQISETRVTGVHEPPDVVAETFARAARALHH